MTASHRWCEAVIKFLTQIALQIGQYRHMIHEFTTSRKGLQPLPPSISCRKKVRRSDFHYSDVIMGAMASPITSLTIVYSTVYSGADQRKHQSYASLAFVWGIHGWPIHSPHKWPVTRKMFPFDDVIMAQYYYYYYYHYYLKLWTIRLKPWTMVAT